MSLDALVAGCFVLSMAMVLCGIALNRDLGGNWLDLPWRYKPLALNLYFGGVIVFLTGYALSTVFG